jgi:ABC-type phosphate transport system ATPase subunit
VNNLKDVGIEVPKRRLTVFTGVSGSGKSSLVFDTIAVLNHLHRATVDATWPSAVWQGPTPRKSNAREKRNSAR